jgi:hypothetical protein
MFYVPSKIFYIDYIAYHEARFGLKEVNNGVGTLSEHACATFNILDTKFSARE